jgi:hypothetical protein
VKTTTTKRRDFLKQAALTAGAVAGAPSLPGLHRLADNGRVHAAPGQGGYGPLVPTPDLRDGVMRLALPEGFQYRSFSVSGEPMSDGLRVPIAMDGMAVFNAPDGRFRLVRNHEDRNAPNLGTIPTDPATSYDVRAGAGTTTLVVNPFTRELERHFVSLSGTTVNCAGGPTPWGSWITCEETNAGTPSGWLKQHGYCFEVPSAANGRVTAAPLLDMGRFSHEAVAVDPNTGIVYETEDNGNTNSGFYRFIPNTPGRLADGGRLELLAVAGLFQYNTQSGQPIGVPLDVTWVPIANPNPPGTSSTAVFNQGRVLGGASFARLEGCWWGNGAVYFASTSGGNAGRGQIWEFRPDGDGGTLTLLFESPSASVLSAPDNLAVSPQGAVLLCEDAPGSDQFLRGLTQDGAIFDFAKNLETNHEWAGATFADADPSWNARSIRGSHPPLGGRWDRITLFVNRQGATNGPTPPASGQQGMTFAIWGPWKDGAL